MGQKTECDNVTGGMSKGPFQLPKEAVSAVRKARSVS